MFTTSYYILLLPVLLKNTKNHIDVPFRTVFQGSPGGAPGVPWVPLGPVPRRFKKVRGSLRRFEKVRESSSRKLEKGSRKLEKEGSRKYETV